MLCLFKRRRNSIQKLKSTEQIQHSTEMRSIKLLNRSSVLDKIETVLFRIRVVTHRKQLYN